MLRRPPSINMKHVDAKQPSFGNEGSADAQCLSRIFVLWDTSADHWLADHRWQYGFLAHCMIPVLDAVTATQPTSYSDILGLDSRIRNFDVPPILQMVDNDGVSASEAMQQAMAACTREIGEMISLLCLSGNWSNHVLLFAALLHLHRNYFTQALNGSQDFTVKHRYAPSVLAVYSSACNLIWTVDTLFSWEPYLSACYMVFWANCFSAAVRGLLP